MVDLCCVQRMLIKGEELVSLRWGILDALECALQTGRKEWTLSTRKKLQGKASSKKYSTGHTDYIAFPVPPDGVAYEYANLANNVGGLVRCSILPWRVD